MMGLILLNNKPGLSRYYVIVQCFQQHKIPVEIWIDFAPGGIAYILGNIILFAAEWGLYTALVV